MEKALRETIARVLELLAASKYEELERISCGVRLSADEIRNAVAEYGCEILPPPPELFELVDTVEIQLEESPSWSVCLPLWTREEGRSDLTLELTIRDVENTPTVEIDDLHVL